VGWSLRILLSDMAGEVKKGELGNGGRHLVGGCQRAVRRGKDLWKWRESGREEGEQGKGLCGRDPSRLMDRRSASDGGGPEGAVDAEWSPFC
jgi:hypothetical protein